VLNEDELDEKLKRLSCIVDKSKSDILKFNAFKYLMKYKWYSTEIKQKKENLDEIDVQLRSLKGKELPKKVADVFKKQQKKLGEERASKYVGSKDYVNAFSNPAPPTAEQLRENLATNAHHHVRSKLERSKTLKKATNQIPAIEERIQELKNKNKECHKEKTTSHHWKYTIKRDKEYREACKLQDKLDKLQKYAASSSPHAGSAPFGMLHGESTA